MNCSDRLAGLVAFVAIVGCTFFFGFFSALTVGLPHASTKPGFWWVTTAALVLVAFALVFGQEFKRSNAAGWLAVISVSFLAVAIVETIPFAAYRLSLGIEIANSASVCAALGTILFFLVAIWRAPPHALVVSGLVFGYLYLMAAFVQSAAVPPLLVYAVPFWTCVLLLLVVAARAAHRKKKGDYH